MTDTDFGDLGIDDFGRKQLIIGLYSAIKALLWLLEAVCMSPAVFPYSWHSRPRFVGLESLKNTDFGGQNHQKPLGLSVIIPLSLPALTLPGSYSLFLCDLREKRLKAGSSTLLIDFST